MTAPTTPALDRALANLQAAVDDVQHHRGSTWFNADTDHAISIDDVRLVLNALTQASAAKVPEGWKLVPIEPTEAMLMGASEVAITAARNSTTTFPAADETRHIWSAMLAATPSETTNDTVAD